LELKINKIFLILFFSLILLLIFNLDVYAANATITLDKENVEVGKPVKITVSGNGVQWNLKLKVDGEVLKTSSEFENYESNKNISFSVSYTPKTAGTKNVTLEGSVTEFSDGSTVKSFSPKSIIVTEKQTSNGGTNTGGNNGTTNNNSSSNNNSTTNNNSGTTTEKPKTKSTNAYLSTLGVTPKEYDFSGFKQTNLTYSVTVPYEVDSLKVLYKTAHSGATVKVTGNSGFVVGSNNKITIKVTAEDGKTTKTYTIKVTKLAEVEEKPGNIIDEEIEGLCLTSLSIKGVELSPEFSKDIYAYTAKLSKTDVTEVEINAVANKENASIEISGNTNLVVGENTINVVVKQEGSTAQAVYQITLTKEAALVTAPTEETNFMSNLIDNIKNYVVIAVGVVVSIIVVIIVLIILLRKESKRLNNEETEEYNVYEKDENEFENKKNEEKTEVETNETETKNEGRRTRREKGRHSK